MKRTSVRSSNLVSVGYDENSQTLEVEFKEGRVYRYFNVPMSVYIALMAASSVGSYHAANIKEKYKYEQIS